jgi:arginine N-succinyltransferase
MTPVARLATERDLPALLALSADADPRVYTLARSREQLERAIERSLDSVSRSVDVPADEQYLVVLECPDGGLGGVASIRATAGSQGTFFAFRNDVVHHVSRDLKITNNIHVLTLSSDLTGHSQLSSFFVDSSRVARAEAAMLSRARLALAALEKHRFSHRFFASLAGWCDEALGSPFWDALGRKFFDMDFIEAERAVAGARNRTFITELMPHYPVYVPMLPAAARAAIGQLHQHSALPYEVLISEGFESETYVDVFDGGVILNANASELGTLSKALQWKAAPMEDFGGRVPCHALIARAAPLREFRCCSSQTVLRADEGVAHLPVETMLALRIDAGEQVLVVAD